MDAYTIIKAGLITSFWYIYYLKISSQRTTTSKSLCTGIIFIALFTGLIKIAAIHVNEPLKSFSIVLFAGIFFNIKSKQHYISTCMDLLITYAISYLLYALSTGIAAISLCLIFKNQGADIRMALCTGTVEIILTLFIMRSKISLPKENHIIGIKFFLSAMIIIFYTLLRKNRIAYNANALWFVVAEIILFCAMLIYWFKKEHIITFNNKVKEVERAALQSTLDNVKEENKLLDDSLRYLEYRLHKEDKRLPAYQEAVEELICSTTDETAKAKALQVLEELKAVRNELSQEQSEELRKSKTLPQTGMILLDAIFADMYHRAAGYNIDFDLILGDINGITEAIPQTQLEVLASDLIVNAIIAVMCSEHTPKSILVYLWLSSGTYELRVDDTGIPFETDTLLSLGKQRITTHKDIGGSGIGFMTIFEILDSCCASLYITEHSTKSCRCSKTIAIRFDKEGKRILRSYRAEQLSTMNEGRWMIE